MDHPVLDTTASSRTASVCAQPSDSENEKGDVKPTTTLREDVAAVGLEKVFARHGRIDLVPMPSDDPEDPYNFADWRKHMLLYQVAFHAMMGPFSAASVVPAFETFMQDFNITIVQAGFTVSIPIIFLGVMPLIWSPIAARIGRRPIYLGSTLISAALHLASAYCTSYGTFMLTRCLQAIFLAPVGSLGASTVGEMFFQHEKGQKLGVWALLTTLGPPLGPLIFGFVVERSGWRVIFYALTAVNVVQFFLFLALGPETLFDRPNRYDEQPIVAEEALTQSWYTPYISFKRWGSVPWSRMPIEIVQPLAMAAHLPVLLMTVAYGVCFAYSNVLLTVEIPNTIGIKYGLNAQQIGLQFIAALIGSILGEPIAGYGSDKYIAWRTKQAKGQREPEMRLPVALPGFVLSTLGVVIFGVQLQNTTAGVWSVTPLLGSGMASFGLQLVTTVAYTFAVESVKPELAVRVPLFIAVVRGLYSFLGPFYFNVMFATMGYASAAGLLAALSGGIGFVCTGLCLVYGKKWRASLE